jgi:hypothetical protein
LAETLVEKEELEKNSGPLGKENEELKEELEALKGELRKTEDVERQVKDVLEKFEGILKTSEEDNKRLRAELNQAGALREENEALKMFVQKATMMVTEERARNQELTKLLEGNLPRRGIAQALEQSRSTADALRDTMRSRQSADNLLRGSDAGSRYDEDQQINEATEDEENEEVESKPESKKSESRKLAQSSDDAEVMIQTGAPANKRQTPSAKKAPTGVTPTPQKASISQQKGSLKKSTPAVKVADSNDFKQVQAQVQLKKNPNPKIVRGSVAIDTSDELAPKGSRNQKEQEDSGDELDQGYDELYQSRRLGMNPTYSRPTGSAFGSVNNDGQLLELLEQNRQLKMMNDLLHTSQKQLLQAKQQEMDSSISKVSLV